MLTQRVGLATYVLIRASKHQAPSHKLQASSTKLFKILDASFKPQAASFKLQAASNKLPDTFSLIKFYRDRRQGLY